MAHRKQKLELTWIGKTVLSRCEWGCDDYSLEVASLKPAPPPEGLAHRSLGEGGQQGLGFEGV